MTEWKEVASTRSQYLVDDSGYGYCYPFFGSHILRFLVSRGFTMGGAARELRARYSSWLNS